MSYGFHRMGSNVPNKQMPKMIFAEMGLTLPLVARLTTPPPPPPLVELHKPTLPALADTMIGKPLTTEQARMQGYTGNQCQTCSSTRMKIAGHCEVCEECGNSTGCS